MLQGSDGGISYDAEPDCEEYRPGLESAVCLVALDLACGPQGECAESGIDEQFSAPCQTVWEAFRDPAAEQLCHALMLEGRFCELTGTRDVYTEQCRRLLARVCGDGGDAGPAPCRDRPACQQAALLRAPLACEQALSDLGLYPVCNL